MRDPVHDVRGLLRAEPQLPEDGARLLRPPRNHLRRRGRRGHARLLLQVRSKARTDRDTGSAEPGSRPIFGSASGSENQF